MPIMNPLLEPIFPITDLGRPPRQRRDTRHMYWHDHIIDLLLVEPGITQKDIAARLGKHFTTISIIMNNDLFKLRYEQRRGEQSSRLTAAINHKLSGVALSALDIVQETLDKKRSALPFEELTDVMDSALERLGYGLKTASGPTVVVNTNAQVVAPISSEDLAVARAKVVAHESKLLDVGPRAAPPASEPVAEGSSASWPNLQDERLERLGPGLESEEGASPQED